MMSTNNKFLDIWQKNHGTLPDDYEIGFKDGDVNNIAITNLSIDGLGIFDDTPQSKLRRMAKHFEYEGIYTKENYCYDIIEYIDDLEKNSKKGIKQYIVGEHTMNRVFKKGNLVNMSDMQAVLDAMENALRDS